MGDEAKAEREWLLAKAREAPTEAERARLLNLAGVSPSSPLAYKSLADWYIRTNSTKDERAACDKAYEDGEV